jgi:hypothetical protein
LSIVLTMKTSVNQEGGHKMNTTTVLLMNMRQLKEVVYQAERLKLSSVEPFRIEITKLSVSRNYAVIGNAVVK